MRRSSLLIAAFAALALAFMPGTADARAGGGGSFGSRGGRTWSAPPATGTSPYGAAPMQRSLTPSSPRYSPGAGFGGGGYGGYAPRSSFMSGLMGGLIGAGIGGLLFGHGFLGGGGLGFGGMLGFLLQLVLIVVVVRFLLRWFRRGSPLAAGAPGLFARTGVSGGAPAGAGGLAAIGAGSSPPIAIGPDDYRAFEQLLVGMQAAWTRHDIPLLQRVATPEMVGVFAEQLAEQTSRGVRNSVTDVRLLHGDLAEAWREGSRDYATVAMRFSMIDVTVDQTGRVVDGSPDEHTTATEMWTFLRGQGGAWVLSAIQQAR